MKKQCLSGWIEMIALMIVLQSALAVMKKGMFLGGETNLFYTKMVTMGCMLFLTLVVALYAKIRKTPLSLKPSHFSKGYVIATVLAVLLFLSTPSIYLKGVPAILVMIYGCIVTPVYEETLFRGYIWNRLTCFIKNEKTVWLVNALLFSLWHLGYVFGHLISGEWWVVGTKLAVGLVYGLILGRLRLKTKNCYATILLHGVMNIFL